MDARITRMGYVKGFLARMDNERLLTNLIGRVYDAGVGAASWTSVLDDLMPAVGAQASALFVVERARPTAALGAQRGYPDNVADTYSSYFADRDVRLPAVCRLQAGEVFVDDRTMPFAEVERSEIYNDFYRPVGVAYGMGVLPFNEGKRFGVLSAHRALRSGNFRTEEVALLERLSPHLTRALQLQRQLARANAVAAALSVALNHFQMALVLTDERGRVIELNHAAESLLRRPGCPIRVVTKRLSAVSPGDAAAFDQAVAGAHGTLCGDANAPPPVLRLAKTDGSGAVGLMVVPARRAEHLGMMVERLVLVFISDPGQAPIAIPELLSGEFGLSPTEARVAARLAAGDRIEDIADAHNVSRETVRVQVKHVFAKTETHSQGQLIGLISRSLPALRRNWPAGR